MCRTRSSITSDGVQSNVTGLCEPGSVSGLFGYGMVIIMLIFQLDGILLFFVEIDKVGECLCATGLCVFEVYV